MKPGDVKNKVQENLEAFRLTISKYVSSEEILEQEAFYILLDEYKSNALDFAYKQGFKEGFSAKQQNLPNNPNSNPVFEDFNSPAGSNPFRSMRTKLINSYNLLSRRYTSTIETHDEILRIDMKEKIRYLCFRILTAIGIAAVVLATAWLAHKFGIQLPLSGLKQVT
jgi:hypothetical protein